MARTTLQARASSASLALCALIAHGADSEVQGSALNRPGSDPTLERDARGKSLLLPEPSRSPGGLLYDWPYEPSGGYRFAAELGALRDSGDAPRIRHYGDYGDGFLLNYLSIGLHRPASAQYIEFAAGAVGREDQFYRASFGRHGDFDSSVYFHQTPHLFTDRARSVFQGAGSGLLTLAPGLTPGNNTPAQVDAALQSAAPFQLGFTRRKAGLDIDVTPDANWRYQLRYSQERKNGTRPSGAASGFPGTPLAETIEPLDYKTHDVLAGVQWVGEAFQANLAYAASFFRNGIDTLSWENPLNVGDPVVLQRGRLDLYPDNDFHNLKLDLGAALPLRGRLNAGVSWSRMTQDDALVAPTPNSGTLGSVDLANWNTTAALSQPSANARIDTLLTHLGGSFSPFHDLALQAKWRRYDENNKTRYAAFNPQTAQSGYLGLDGGVNNIVPNNLFSVQLHSIPFECTRDNLGADGDYRLLRRTNLTLGYERENVACRYRESGRTREDRVRAALNNRDLPWATTRLSYEYAQRSGEGYDFAVNRHLYAPSAFLNPPATLAELRKYDLADREQHVAKARVNLQVATDMDLALSGQVLHNLYGAPYGRLDEHIHAFNAEWNWQAGPKSTAYAHYGYERRRNRMALIADDPAGWFSGDPHAGGAAYPLANRWDEDSRDSSHLAGLGFRYGRGRTTLETAYSYLYAPYRTRYSFASSGALVGGAAAAAAAGDRMPDIRFRHQALETSLRFAFDRSTALRLFYRYEHAHLDDWHYDGLPLVSGTEGVFLGAAPRNYRNHLLGLFVQYTARGD